MIAATLAYTVVVASLVGLAAASVEQLLAELALPRRFAWFGAYAVALVFPLLAMLLAGPYLLAAVLCVGWIERGGPGWLNLLVLLFLWNAIKFVVVGPVSLLWLARVRVGEARVRRLSRVAAISDEVPLQERMSRSPARVLH